MRDHNLFPKKVTLNEDNHRYFDTEGNEYVGFSKFSTLFGAGDFEAKKDMIAHVTAKSQNVDKSVILEGWDQKRDNGNRYDKALELTALFGYVPPEYADIEQLVKSIIAEYDQYHSTYEQVVVYNEHYRIAGSPDKFMLTSGRKDGSFEMSDFKVFEKDDLLIPRGWYSAPFSHLPKTKYIKIAMQLSYYAFQLEELLGKRCRHLFIHLINPINNTHTKVPVPYLKNDILIALEANKEKIQEMVSPSIETMF